MADAVPQDGFIREANRGSEAGFEVAHRLLWEKTTTVTRRPTFARLIPFDGLVTNKLLTALPGEEFARLLPHLEPVFLPSNHDLYELGEDIDFIYFPETAVISHVYYLEDGSTAGATIVGNEGMVGLSAVLDGRPSYWTQVTIAGTAVRIKPAIVKTEFVRGNAMQPLLLKYMSSRLAQLSQRAVCNGRHRLKDRFCTWLLMIHDRARGPELPLTHEEIANHLGARRPGITSSCNALKDKGIIRYRRGLIEIVDRERLEATACECYRALKAV